MVRRKVFTILLLLFLLSGCAEPVPEIQTIISETETTYATTRYFSINNFSGIMRFEDRDAGVVCWIFISTGNSFGSISCLPLADIQLELREIHQIGVGQ